MCTSLQSFAVGTATARTFEATATSPSGTGSWATGTPTASSESANSAVHGANLGGIRVGFAGIVVGALGAGLYLF
jgi:hypothetical protein